MVLGVGGGREERFKQMGGGGKQDVGCVEGKGVTGGRKGGKKKRREKGGKDGGRMEGRGRKESKGRKDGGKIV